MKMETHLFFESFNNRGMFQMKKHIASLFLLLASVSVFALPGVQQSIPDQSGQFVYYRDSSFERESYVGIIYFDESTYGLRYFAPASDKQAEVKLQFYFTLDTEKAASKGIIEFTGETPPDPFPKSQDETDIVNYLHDIAYEMFPKRIFLGELKEKTSSAETYSQFGGRVTMEYDPMIPVLNLDRIVTSDGKVAFCAVTGGKLTDSSDTSFSDFKGIPAKVSYGSASKIKKGKASDMQIENEGLKSQTFKIDSNWEQKSAASWMLGSVSAIATAALPISDAQKGSLMRMLILGRDHSYPDWSKMKVSDKNGKIELDQVFYDSSSKSFKYDKKRIENIGEGTKSIFSLTVDAGSYNKNKKYFDSIVSSYEVK